ncbi:hypothetical protein D9M71_645640 [compost metagenome]
MLVDLVHHLAQGTGVGVQLVHLDDAQVIKTQQLHGRRVAGLDTRFDVVHDIGDAHQAALELPTIDRCRHPRL